MKIYDRAPLSAKTRHLVSKGAVGKSLLMQTSRVESLPADRLIRNDLYDTSRRSKYWRFLLAFSSNRFRLSLSGSRFFLKLFNLWVSLRKKLLPVTSSTMALLLYKFTVHKL